MMGAQGVHRITEEFEQAICDYTGARFAACVDNQTNALFLALMYEGVENLEITIPARTYPSVPCEIIHAGAKVKFEPSKGKTLKGAYQLKPTSVWDSALRFTADMYIPGSLMCVSFTGPYKHLKLSKGGAVLTDDEDAWRWLKRARFSGRRECGYLDDRLDMLGWNFYMMPELAARGLLLIKQFYTLDNVPVSNDDLEIEYPDLSQFKIYQAKEQNQTNQTTKEE